MVADVYYKNYLYGQLELVFNENGEYSVSNFLLENKREPKAQNNEQNKYTSPTPIELTNYLINYHHIDLDKVSLRRPQAIELPNGIVGVRYKEGWFFPQINLLTNCMDEFIRYFDNGYFSK